MNSSKESNKKLNIRRRANTVVQRTLFQCWGKTDIYKRSSDVDVDVIEIDDDTNSCFISATGSSVSSSSKLNRSSSAPFPRVERSTGNSGKELATYRKNSLRQCPFYKRVGDAPYAVDAFNYAYDKEIQAYFLSHFHSDHYTGLGSRFSRPVYCSEVTANLVRLKLKVSTNLIQSLPMGRMMDLPDGTQVQLLNANHCPGAVLFVFRLKNGRIIVHTGDMRADQSVLDSCALLFRDLPRMTVTALHLDTTYCHPKFSFPSQLDVLNELTERVKNEIRQKPRLLIVVGAYQIGKERVFKAIADCLDTKIFVQKEKWEMLGCLKDKRLCERLTLDPHQTQLHVVGMGCVNNQALTDYLGAFSSYDSILGISATGWEFGRSGIGWRVTRRGNTTVIGVPYSEHSSYDELKRLVQLVRPCRVIPTVNVGNEKKRKEMQEIFAQWLKEGNDGVISRQQRIDSFSV